MAGQSFPRMLPTETTANRSILALTTNEWKALLTDAGVRDARLHDARHTAATVLLLLGVPSATVMEIMGWSKWR